MRCLLLRRKKKISILYITLWLWSKKFINGPLFSSWRDISVHSGVYVHMSSSARACPHSPSKQPLMVRTFLKVYMELCSYFVSARTNKRHHDHHCVLMEGHFGPLRLSHPLPSAPALPLSRRTPALPTHLSFSGEVKDSVIFPFFFCFKSNGPFNPPLSSPSAYLSTHPAIHPVPWAGTEARSGRPSPSSAFTKTERTVSRRSSL
jgi:hypothetical protein